ncbi:MAG: 2'-5' RNA ligase family protein [Methanoregulaceae archaeon]|jgi:calcineurin-like phosphoesterase family protein/2'-5' RNA ligase
MKYLARQVYKKYHIGSSHYVPHITLVGGFETPNEAKLIKDVYQLCSSFPVMHFGIRGFSTFDENRVVFLDISPSEGLKQFRWELAQRLCNYCSLKKPFDFHSKDDFAFHSTVAMDIPPHKFSSIKKYIFSTNIPLNNEYILARVTIIKSNLILREYDFLQRKLLTRFEAKNPVYYRKTERLLNDYLEQRYDPNRNISTRPQITGIEPGIRPSFLKRRTDGYLQNLSRDKTKSIFQVLFNIFKPPKTYIIADLHLDHANIIRFCNRPFPDVESMNLELVENWNSVVTNKDTVYFLGDLVWGRSNKGHKYWIKKLDGNKKYIEGNHDKGAKLPFLDNPWLLYKGKKFYLIHDPYPDKIPKGWEGWIIHGHHHNNELENYPFINGKTKTINASAELINFKPLDLDYLFDLDFEKIEYMKDINSEPQRFLN